MIPLDIPQGTTEWLMARLPRLTASEMKKNITATGKLSRSVAALDSIGKMIAGINCANEMYKRRDELREMDERGIQDFIAHYTGDSFKGNLHTERGHDFEPNAVAALEKKVGLPATDIGMCVMGDDKDGMVSCSPDALFYESDGTLNSGGEVKCPTLAKFQKIVREGVLPADYKMQVHASMVVCEVETWHFGAYFEGKNIFHLPVKWDKFTDDIKSALVEFQDLYRDEYDAVSEAMYLLSLEPDTLTHEAEIEAEGGQ